MKVFIKSVLLVVFLGSISYGASVSGKIKKVRVNSHATVNSNFNNLIQVQLDNDEWYYMDNVDEVITNRMLSFAMTAQSTGITIVIAHYDTKNSATNQYRIQYMETY